MSKRLDEPADPVAPFADPATVTEPEPLANQRIRALMIADERGWLEYLYVVDADTVDPTALEYAVRLDGAPADSLPRRLRAGEVLPFVYALAHTHGEVEAVAYRRDLPI